MKLRIACVQYNPLLGKVDANIARVKTLLSNFNREIDLLVLPELSITGYNFASPLDIAPFLEKKGSGPSFEFAKALSKQFKCTTVLGYPETFSGVTYNSAMAVNDSGVLAAHYRKTHLYETDEVWGASENPEKGFAPFELELGPQKKPILTNIGICMDLNPYQFKAPFNSFEFLLQCWENQSSLIIVPTAWLSSQAPCAQDGLSKEEKDALAKKFTEAIDTNTFADAQKPNDELVEYWLLRFFPFLAHPNNQLPKKQNKTTVVICNRTGVEEHILYGGLSSILQFDPSAGESMDLNRKNPSADFLASAGQATEEVIYHEVDL